MQTNGRIYLRVREIGADGKWKGKFLNDVKARLTDTTGDHVYGNAIASAVNKQDGWVYFDDIKPGKYGIMVFQKGYVGAWKQTNCDAGYTNDGVTIQTKILRETWQGGKIL